MIARALLLATAMISSGGRSSLSTPVLEPSGKWVVDYQEGMCVLSRRYGENDRTVQLGFRAVPTQPRTELVLLTAGAGNGPRTGQGGWALDSNTPTVSEYSSYPIVRLGQRITTLDVMDNLVALMSKASIISIDSDRGRLTFHLQGIGAASAAFATCQDDLLQRWGVDPAVVRTLSTFASPVGGNTARLFSADSYPANAIAAGAQGRAVGVVTIDVTGKATDCRIVESAGNADLDKATCATVMRASFNPARDAKGSPVASTFVVPVKWVLPRPRRGGPAL